MSLSESMHNVGRPIAYYPRLSKFFGSVNASIIFSQLFYWNSRTENPLGVYKTAEDFEEETGLTYREQATARKHLVERGFLTETHKRLEHRVYYKLNLECIDAEFGQWQTEQSPKGGNSSPPNDENAIRGCRKTQSVNKAETTTETTAKNTSASANVIQRPESVSEQVWKDWLVIRKKKGAPLTETAWSLMTSQAAKAGWPIEKAIEECCLRNWQSFKADWVADKQGWNGNKPAHADGTPLNKQEALEASNRAVVARFLAKEAQREAQ